jgi:hypothetical protein
MMRKYRRLLAVLVFAVAVLLVPAPVNAEESALLFVFHDPSGSPEGPYRLQFEHSKQCLTIPGGSRTDGAWLVQEPCGSVSYQRWQLQIASNGIDFRLRSPYNGKCVNIDHANYTNGTHIIQWPCGVFSNEYFKQAFESPSMPPADLFWIVPSQSTNFALNVANGSTSSGAKVILWQRGPFANEYIRLQPVS